MGVVRSCRPTSRAKRGVSRGAVQPLSGSSVRAGCCRYFIRAWRGGRFIWPKRRSTLAATKVASVLGGDACDGGPTQAIASWSQPSSARRRAPYRRSDGRSSKVGGTSAGVAHLHPHKVLAPPLLTLAAWRCSRGSRVPITRSPHFGMCAALTSASAWRRSRACPTPIPQGGQVGDQRPPLGHQLAVGRRRPTAWATGYRRLLRGVAPWGWPSPEERPDLNRARERPR